MVSLKDQYTVQYSTVQYSTALNQVLRAWFLLKPVKPVRTCLTLIEKPVRYVSYMFGKKGPVERQGPV